MSYQLYFTNQMDPSVEQLYLLEILIEKVQLAALKFTKISVEMQFGEVGTFTIDQTAVGSDVNLNEPPSPSVDFSSGKSMLFPMKPEALISCFDYNPLKLTILSKDNPIAKANIEWDVSFGEMIKSSLECDRVEKVPPNLMIDTFNLYNIHFNEMKIGEIVLLIRLSCLGTNIMTQFQVVPGKDENSKSYLFKHNATDAFMASLKEDEKEEKEFNDVVPMSPVYSSEIVFTEGQSEVIKSVAEVSETLQATNNPLKSEDPQDSEEINEKELKNYQFPMKMNKFLQVTDDAKDKQVNFTLPLLLEPVEEDKRFENDMNVYTMCTPTTRDVMTCTMPPCFENLKNMELEGLSPPKPPCATFNRKKLPAVPAIVTHKPNCPEKDNIMCPITCPKRPKTPCQVLCPECGGYSASGRTCATVCKEQQAVTKHEIGAPCPITNRVCEFWDNPDPMLAPYQPPLPRDMVRRLPPRPCPLAGKMHKCPMQKPPPRRPKGKPPCSGIYPDCPYYPCTNPPAQFGQPPWEQAPNKKAKKKKEKIADYLSAMEKMKDDKPDKTLIGAEDNKEAKKKKKKKAATHKINKISYLNSKRLADTCCGCTAQLPNRVPANMGWLWTCHPKSSQGWRPGAVDKKVHEIMRRVKELEATDTKPAVTKNRAHSVDRDEIKDKTDIDSNDMKKEPSDTFDPTVERPSISIEKKDGSYLISMMTMTSQNTEDCFKMLKNFAPNKLETTEEEKTDEELAKEVVKKALKGEKLRGHIKIPSFKAICKEIMQVKEEEEEEEEETTPQTEDINPKTSITTSDVKDGSDGIISPTSLPNPIIKEPSQSNIDN